MVVAWHDAAFTLAEPVLTPELMRRVLSKFRLQHELKQNWSKEEARLYEKLLFADEAKLKGERDPEAVRKQAELTKKIEEERMNMKAMREV